MHRFLMRTIAVPGWVLVSVVLCVFIGAMLMRRVQTSSQATAKPPDEPSSVVEPKLTTGIVESRPKFRESLKRALIARKLEPHGFKTDPARTNSLDRNDLVHGKVIVKCVGEGAIEAIEIDFRSDSEESITSATRAYSEIAVLFGGAEIESLRNWFLVAISMVEAERQIIAEQKMEYRTMPLRTSATARFGQCRVIVVGPKSLRNEVRVMFVPPPTDRLDLYRGY